MPNIDNLKKYKNIHMIGIGGVSMSGIAEKSFIIGDFKLLALIYLILNLFKY